MLDNNFGKTLNEGVNHVSADVRLIKEQEKISNRIDRYTKFLEKIEGKDCSSDDLLEFSKDMDMAVIDCLKMADKSLNVTLNGKGKAEDGTLVTFEKSYQIMDNTLSSGYDGKCIGSIQVNNIEFFKRYAKRYINFFESYANGTADGYPPETVDEFVLGNQLTMNSFTKKADKAKEKLNNQDRIQIEEKAKKEEEPER